MGKNIWSLIAFVLLLAACSSPVSDELVEYHNESWLEFQTMKEEFTDSTEETAQIIETGDLHEAVDRLEQDIIPLTNNMLNHLEDTDLEQEEVQELNQMQIDVVEQIHAAMEMQHEAIQMAEDGQWEEAMDLDMQSGEYAEEGLEMQDAFDDQRETLWEEHDVEEEGGEDSDFESDFAFGDSIPDNESDNDIQYSETDESSESASESEDGYEEFEYEGAWPDDGVDIESSDSELENDLLIFLEAQVDEEFPEHSQEYLSYLQRVITAFSQNVTVDVHYDRFMDVVPDRIRDMERAEIETDEVNFIRTHYLEGMETHHDAVESLEEHFDAIHEEEHDPQLEEDFNEAVEEGTDQVATSYIQMIKIAEETDVLEVDDLKEMEEFIDEHYNEEVE